jgi:hypothetical protein
VTEFENKMLMKRFGPERRKQQEVGENCIRNKNKFELIRWPCGLRRRSAATRLLGLQVRIPLRASIYV